MEERDALLESFCELSSLPEFSERCGKEEQKSIREREREGEGEGERKVTGMHIMYRVTLSKR